MRLHRFYINSAIGEIVPVTEPELINQWLRVFRMKVGDKIVLFNGDGFDYVCRFEKLEKNEAGLAAEEKIKNEITPKIELTLCQAIIKKDNFEWIVEKGTELGVSAFQPIISERSEKKNLNMERLEIIAKEATEQSGRNKLPKLQKLLKLEEALESIKNDCVVFDASGSPFFSFDFKLSTLNLFVGPEGGFTPSELELFKSKNIPIVSLGKATLRAETAAIAGMSLILL